MAGKVIEYGLSDLVGVVVSCHMGGSMVPQHDVTFVAPAVHGHCVVVDLFDFLQVLGRVQYSLVAW